MQHDDSCLTYNSTLNVTHTVRPESQSVNQKKRGKTHLPQIRELATDLCKILDIPLHENDRDASLECQFCGSQMWFAERLKGLKKILVAQFGICCCKGKIIVPLLKRPPEELEQLFFNKDSSHAKKFLRNIRLYNMFSFTSMGGRIDHSINSKGGGPYSFVLSGQNHHLIGSLLPPQGNPPVYAQLYIYDTENEVSNRISTVSHVGGEHLDQSIVEMLKEFLDKHNCVVKHYRNVAEIIKQNVISDYPLLFPYGDNGYDSSNEHAQESLSTTKKKKKLTPREYMEFRLMRRKFERCSYQRRDGPFIDRTSSYFTVFFYWWRTIHDSNYQDAMAICAWAGYPDIFLTFTCNPMWPEITRHCEKDGLKPCDKPEILSRVFYMKLDKLMRILKDEKILGSIKAGLYNGTRLQITQLGKNVVKAKALNGTSAGEEILIHRMDMNPSETTLPFKMTRRQFQS
ncbi:hypothetical protein K1719_017731 [Acacia pycnantha]|nr:hypothetical protein K1719_017731 [Acacia pycnantha]